MYSKLQYSLPKLKPYISISLFLAYLHQEAAYYYLLQLRGKFNETQPSQAIYYGGFRD